MICLFRCQPARRKICRYVLAVVKQHKIYKFLCTNNFFARNHHKMHLGALFNISLREKGRWGRGGVQIKLLKGQLNTFRIKGANDQIRGQFQVS